MNSATTNAPKRTGYSRLKEACARTKARIRPYALALGMGIAAPLLSGALAAGCGGLGTSTSSATCETKTPTDISSYVVNVRNYVSRDNKIYSNSTKELCPESDTQTLVEADLAAGASKVVAEGVGPVGNLDGANVLLLSALVTEKNGDSCTSAMSPVRIYNADVGAVGDTPVVATVAWLAGTGVAYEADNGNNGYDIFIYDIASGDTRRVAQGMRLVAEGIPFDGKTVFAYNDEGLWSVDALTAGPTLANSDNTVVPYPYEGLVGYHDKVSGSVNFFSVPDNSQLFSLSVAGSDRSPRPVAFIGNYVVSITQDLGVEIRDLTGVADRTADAGVADMSKLCDVTIPFSTLTAGWNPSGDITSFVAQVRYAGPTSFIYEFSNPGSGEGFAALVEMK